MTVRFAREGAVEVVTLDRPERLNAMSDAMWDALHDRFEALVWEEDVRAVLVTGAGRAFCSGGDVTNMANSDHVSSRLRTERRSRAIRAIANLEKPVIAAARGPVVGIGTAIALACDLVMMSDTAYYMFAFKKVGAVPDGGALWFLTQHLGVQRAKELVYTARKVPAQEAKDIGLASRVVPDADLEKEAMALAQEMADSPTFALAMAKKMFQSMYLPDLNSLLELEKLASGAARMSEDHKEAVAAFKEKRPPRFRGR